MADERPTPQHGPAPNWLAEMWIIVHLLVVPSSFGEISQHLTSRAFFFDFPRACWDAIGRILAYGGGVSIPALEREIARVYGSRFDGHFPWLHELLVAEEQMVPAGHRQVVWDHVGAVVGRMRNRDLAAIFEQGLARCAENYDARATWTAAQQQGAALEQSWSRFNAPASDRLEIEKRAAQASAAGKYDA